MYNRYSDASKFITPDKWALDSDGLVYISNEDDYDLAVDFERCCCSFEEAKPFIALVAKQINELDNTVQRFYNKQYNFSPLRETEFYLNLISLPKPEFVTLEYVFEKVNSQFDVVFEYKGGRFFLREFGLVRDIPDDWDEGV